MLAHPQNADDPTNDTLSGSSIAPDTSEHWKKAKEPIDSRTPFAGNEIEIKPTHPSKAPLAMLVTALLIVISPEQHKSEGYDAFTQSNDTVVGTGVLLGV